MTDDPQCDYCKSYFDRRHPDSIVKPRGNYCPGCVSKGARLAQGGDNDA